MVWSLGNANMAGFARLQGVGSALQTVKEEVHHQKLAAKCTRKDFRESNEENLLDEDDMHIFGLRPMTDSLDLVCCNNCKKPIKASQYTVHAGICKSLYSRIIPEPAVPAVNKKPAPKERKKLLTHANQAAARRDPKKDKSIDIGNADLYGTRIMNGSRVGSCNVECPGNITHPSKPFRRAVGECPTNQGDKSVCMTAAKDLPGTEGLSVTTAKALPYVPEPLATKIYYSQRNHDLRRAICHMFYEELGKDSSHDASQLEVLRANAVLAQTQSPENFHGDQVMNEQGDTNILHRARKPDQILAASSEMYLAKSGGCVPSMNLTSQIPVNINIEPHYMSTPYSFAD